MGTTSIRFAKPPAPREQIVMFVPSLDESIAADDPVRLLKALLDEVDWTPWELAYEGCGQPPIHPKYLAGAILHGLLHKIRSTRDLEYAARKNVDFIWLIEGFTPDHSTFAAFHKRHALGIRGLNRYLAQQLLGGRNAALLRFLLDGTRLRADSARDGARTAAFLEALVGELTRRLERLTEERAEDSAMGQEHFEGMAPAEDPRAWLARLDQEIAQLERQRAQCAQALGIARERDARTRQHDGKNATPVRVPLSDPDSQVTPNKEGGYAPNYTPVAAVEPETGAVVLGDVLVGSDEAAAVLPAVEAVTALAGQKPDEVLADSNFAAGEVLEALAAADIVAYMPTRSISPPDNPAHRPDPCIPVAQADRDRLPKHGGKFARTAFVYDERTDRYGCPQGHWLLPYKHGHDRRGAACTYYQGQACPTCPWVSHCIQGKGPYRTLTRDEYEPLREAAAQRMATPEGKAAYRLRAPYMEGVFGFVKRDLAIRGFRLRGLANVRIEWTWICTAYNLKKLLLRMIRARAHPPARCANATTTATNRTRSEQASTPARPRGPIGGPNLYPLRLYGRIRRLTTHATPHWSGYLCGVAA